MLKTHRYCLIQNNYDNSDNSIISMQQDRHSKFKEKTSLFSKSVKFSNFLDIDSHYLLLASTTEEGITLPYFLFLDSFTAFWAWLSGFSVN